MGKIDIKKFKQQIFGYGRSINLSCLGVISCFVVPGINWLFDWGWVGLRAYLFGSEILSF
jgi:hypothetical protein